jgi:hypothetical protein
MLEPHHQNREIAKTSGAELNEDTQGGAAGWLSCIRPSVSRSLRPYLSSIPGTSCRLSLPWSCGTEKLLLFPSCYAKFVRGHSEPAPTSSPSRMDDMWSGNSFLLGSSALSNHGG